MIKIKFTKIPKKLFYNTTTNIKLSNQDKIKISSIGTVASTFGLFFK
jgi:hypothetical protein